MATTFDKFLIVLKKWPSRSQRKGRDYGNYLREFCKTKSSASYVFFQNPNDDNKTIESLLRLTENVYFNKYATNYKFGATGLTSQELEAVLSDDFIKQYNQKTVKFRL